MRETVKKVVASIMAMATISIFFSGCSKQDPTSSNSTPITSSISTSYTSSSVSSSLTPGTDISTDITDNSLFHWVEEPTGSALAVSIAELFESSEVIAETSDNEYRLPVLANRNVPEEKYMHAGNLLLPLDADGGFINESDEMLVRNVHEPNTDSGAKIYLYRNKKGELRKLSDDNLEDNEDISKHEDIAARSDKFWKILNGRVVVDHNSYVTKVAAEGNDVDIPDNALVWYNGITTDIRSKGEMIPLKVLTDDFMNILDYTKSESGYDFTLYTGIGAVGVNAVQGGNSWVFKYSIPTNCKLEQPDVTLPSTAISEADGEVYVSDEVLKQVFKYFVFAFKSVDMGDGNTDDIAVIITDNQDIIKSNQSSQGDSSSNSEPDTHEPTSSSSSSSDTSKPTSKPTTSEPTSSSSNSGTTSSSKPTGETSKPTSSSSQPTSKPSSQPVTSTWNPDAPGNTPGPYGGYYDANGALHAIAANVPLDSTGAPVVSFWTEYGSYRMTRAENDKAIEEEKRISAGGDPDTSGFDWDALSHLR